jgi:hypothetical protein
MTMLSASHFNGRCVRHRGAIYVYVLATSLLVSVIGLSLLTVTQINNRVTRQGNESDEAEVLAESAVEFALNTLGSDNNWRLTYTSNLLNSGRALGHGTLSFKVVDETDGVLANNTTDPIRIYGYGQVNNTTKVYSVQVAASPGPLTCLQVATDSNGTMTFNSTAVTGAGTMASNTYVTGSGTLTGLGLESAGSLNFSGPAGSRSNNVAARTLPDSTVFSQYTAASLGGTTVTLLSVPLLGSPLTRTIDHKLVSPSSMLYATANTKGIYIVDCAGGNFNITNSRIVGTLVFLNAGTVTLSTSDIVEPAVSNYPVLLVQGNLQILSTTANVIERVSGTDQVNMNPSTTPIPFLPAGSGTSDGSTTGSFASSIKGLIYASGNVTFGNQPNVRGVVVSGGTLSSSGTLTLNYDSTYFSNPPPGFTGAGSLSVVSGSWRWEAAP